MADACDGSHAPLLGHAVVNWLCLRKASAPVTPPTMSPAPPRPSAPNARMRLVSGELVDVRVSKVPVDFFAICELSVGACSSSRLTVSDCPSESVMARSVGRYPSAETLIVWLPGLTGLLTPSDAMGTGVLSMTT